MSLHGDIMNLACGDLPAEVAHDNARLALKVGHKQARHAAAELANAADAELAAWRERFPQHRYRPQDGCIELVQR